MLLSVQQLEVSFDTEKGELRAVDGVSFVLEEGRSLGIVGESGCGKSATALSLSRLLPVPPARYGKGKVLFEGTDLLSLSSTALSKLRGKQIGMIFQEPMTSLNPVYTVGNQIAEALELHFPDWSPTQVRKRVVELLNDVGIGDPERRAENYPHQLSGGMRQRVMIAIALSCRPKLIIADEPTTALDVTIQAQILELLRQLQAEYGTSLILISHDLGVVAEMVEEVLVMYAGKVVEQATVTDLFSNPRHPYTQGLLKSIPLLGNIRTENRQGREVRRLVTIPGSVPNPVLRPSGCLFEERCPIRVERCREAHPDLESILGVHRVACYEVRVGHGSD